MMSNWVFSGEQLHEISDKTLYHSRSVDEFLTSDRKLILLSSKGMGKTHLLRQKRSDLIKTAEGKSAVFIPQSSGSDVDRETSFPKNLGYSHWASISQEDWATLWEISITLSVLLHKRKSLEDNKDSIAHSLIEIAEDDDVPASIYERIYAGVNGDETVHTAPIYILNGLLAQSTTSRQRLLRKAPNLILQLYPHYVGSSVFVFIDSVDQALSDASQDNLDMWVMGQAGLAMAARNIFVNNAHIKVFTAIRQEAWNKFQDENKEVIESFCCFVSYTKDEVRKILDHLSRYYEGSSDFDSVLNTQERGVIRNFGIHPGEGEFVKETLFDYVFRHSLGSPRSILHIVNGIFTQVDRSLAPEKLEKQIRREVNLKSGAIAETKIHSEMARFLNFLSDQKSRTSFFSLLRGNIYSSQDLKEVAEYLSVDFGGVHPFCELFNLGLLGFSTKDVDGELIQHFKSPLEFDWRLEGCLPEATYYFLHPALEALLSYKYRLQVEPNALISGEAAWETKWGEEIQKRTLKVFISYSTDNIALRRRVTTAIARVFLIEGKRFEVWIDENEIVGGQQITAAINRGIEWADVMLCLVTPEYLASGWCKREYQSMLTVELNNTGKRLLPFIFDGADRKELGALLGGALSLSIDATDDASILDIAQALLRRTQ